MESPEPALLMLSRDMWLSLRMLCSIPLSVSRSPIHTLPHLFVARIFAPATPSVRCPGLSACLMLGCTLADQRMLHT